MTSALQKQANPTASIILLTHNSAKTIGAVLEGIALQDFHDHELLLIDTNSVDNTVEIAKQYPCKIFNIKPNEFGHGKTRNYAASIAKGRFLIFLTHDSVPKSKNWLSEMLKPLAKENVVGVYGRQVPRPDENILDKYFQSSLYGSREIIWNNENWRQGDNLFSDANSAVRKETLINYPYPKDIIVSEDYAWAIDVLKHGYNIVYNPKACVVHSHSYNLRSLFRRHFDIGVSFKAIFVDGGSGHFFVKGLKITLLEVKHLKKSGHTKLVPLAILRDIVRLVAINLGKCERLFPKNIKRKFLSAQGWYWK